MSRKDDFIRYIKNNVYIQNPSYPGHFGERKIETLDEFIKNLTGINFYEDVNNEGDLNTLLDKLRENSEWNTYNRSNGSNVPLAILKTHYKEFLKEQNQTANAFNVENEKHHLNVTSISDALNEETEKNHLNVTSISDALNVENEKHPLNQILYGPPGTGKTHSISEYINKLLGKNVGLNTENEEQTINDVVSSLSWYAVIALTMYKAGKDKKHKVADLKEENIFKIFVQTKETKSITASFWGELQAHTNHNSSTVKATNRREPFIFDKTESSDWYLTDDGIKFVEENLSEQLELLSEKKHKRKIEDFYKFLTFHQSYSYEEFVEGIKPQINEDISKISYEYNKGVFKEICQQANSDPKNKYLLIIDEINRGNISKIFGELITLIEDDKRVTPNGERIFENTIINGEQLLVTLPYTKSKFGVPKNLYILGTMNTSDRSIASIDIALRRRFKFVEMMPNSDLVADFKCNFKKIFESMNTKIKILLDRDHQIGHSYFIKTKYENADIETLKEIWFDSIIPLLNEYFYGDWEKLQAILGEAREDEKSFISRINCRNLFNTNNDDMCDETYYDFNYNCNFEEAMRHAFDNLFPEGNNANS